MMPRHLLAAVLAFAPLAAHARIGETYDEIAKRFGKPVLNNRDSGSASAAWLLTGGVAYTVMFDSSNRSIAENLFSKEPAAPLSETQVQSFLKSQLAKNVEWKRRELGSDDTSVPFGPGQMAVNPATDLIYLSSDGLLLAHMDKTTRRLVVALSQIGVTNAASVGPGR